MLIYDCEIVNAIPSKSEAPVAGINYCKGWEDYPGMGISCIGVCDYSARTYRVFCKDNLAEFAVLAAQHDILVGFNSLKFDNALLEANGVKLPSAKCYDLLVEVWAGVGLGPKFDPKTHGGYGLEAVCKTNFGMEKSGNGALAPVLWQQGKIGKVIDYCLNDIRLTKRLLDQVILSGFIRSPKNPSAIIEIRKPKGKP